MTARAALTQAALDRAAKVAAAQGVVVRITARDGTVYEITPALDAKPESDQPASDFDTWKAKREGQHARRS
jgi:hypothetical protein